MIAFLYKAHFPATLQEAEILHMCSNSSTFCKGLLLGIILKI